MIISKELVSIAILLFVGFIQCSEKNTDSNISNEGEITNLKTHNASNQFKQQLPNKVQQLRNQKYSSKIIGSRYTSTENFFGIRTFPASKNNNLVNETKTKSKILTTTETVLDFRIVKPNKKNQEKDKSKKKDDARKKDMATASTGGEKQKKEPNDEEEKTLSQQVADGKYGLIQNEIFSNGSKRPGILSYSSNAEVPKDTKENFGGLEKDEIWLAEDHILVLRGGNYQDTKENEALSSPVWPPIDDFQAPNRQVKIPKNPEIPPPFPIQLSENGPVKFIKGQQQPSAIPNPPLPTLAQDSRKSLPFPFSPNIPSNTGNKTLSFPIPPNLLPPFLSNLPPGATFVAPPDNQTDFDEDDPSIYYPPRYDFYYPQDNTTVVPPGPLVPGIILPPPPDFFSLFENDTDLSVESQNETDDRINSVTPHSLPETKYLPALRKSPKSRISVNRYLKRPISVINLTDTNVTLQSSPKSGKPPVTYIYPENSKSKSVTTTTPSSFRANVKVPSINSFTSPIFVPSNPNRSVYHPLPTTSPKPNHITLPTTKVLPKQIFIITTPETVDKNRIEDIYKNSKPVDVSKYELINPEIHPLRSLIKPNVTISYNGKYGHLPPPAKKIVKPEEGDDKIIRGHYVTMKSPVTKASKAPSTDINSITVTPVPVVKKIRIHPVVVEKPEVVTPPSNPSKATFYFYEESSTTEAAKPPLTPEKAKEVPIAVTIQPTMNAHVKSEVRPVTQYQYSTKSTNKTPIRQYLEETFHSSNVLSRKPQLGHINNAEIITHNSYSDIPKMKHLNYGTHVSSKPPIKYHYVTEDNTVVIPSPKIKDLEIKNSGLSGLQNVNLDKIAVRPTAKPIVVQPSPAFKPISKPETHNPLAPNYAATPKPAEHQNTDSPFVPSSYYATARPEHIHFTSQEQTLVDDITKNYFTIFGQKINLPSTTPLTPVKPYLPKTKVKPESGLMYVSENGNNYKIQQTHDSAPRKPATSSAPFFTNDKSKATPQTHPQSNFEKYLKELTGEDQREFIISGIFPAKIKKGKEILEPSTVVEGIPSHLLSQSPIIFQSGQPPLTKIKNSEQGSRVLYSSSLSTTLRPVDIEIKPQHIQHISSTANPFAVYEPQIPPKNIHFSSNFQQYLQEITGLTSPTTTRPVKVKKPKLDFFPTNSPGSIKPIGFQHSPYQIPEIKPISLGEDILVNYKHPRPVINPEAELIKIHKPALSFDVSSNIKIVDSPDLSRNSNQPYSTKQITFGLAKDFFGNLPKPGYFTPLHLNGGNSFVSYNLPGNGGHFYFLTPQILQKTNEEETRRQDKGYKRVNRSEEKLGRRMVKGETDGNLYQEERSIENGFSNHEYLRRRRKKS